MTETTKLRPFISGLDMDVLPNGTLKLVYEKYQKMSTGDVRVQFSSSSCRVNVLYLNVVIFDPSTPGVLYVDGFFQQNSL